ncbi:MAG: anthranilate synthase component I family protein [Thermoflavifilum sp.]|nr:anthranilate synthase component I family protein [Thermoflavifilum sp.]
MKPVRIHTRAKRLLADIFTPVGIYLRIRDRYPGSILLESTDYHAADNSFSFICINPIAGIEFSSTHTFEFKYPLESPERHQVKDPQEMMNRFQEFLQRFQFSGQSPVPVTEGMFGYTAYDAVQFFENIHLHAPADESMIPLMRYRFYQYVIAINHFKDELFLCENQIDGLSSEFEQIETLIRRKDVPLFPFKRNGAEQADMQDEDYIHMVEKGIAHCHRGDVFQIVLSRSFAQPFLGDEFNVYRHLRSINPSPYLFYFDYGNYRLMGSSPESQLIIRNGKATIHPIAGTFRRTGDDQVDEALARKLENDPKENAEHVMLVDLARNDLSRYAQHVEVTSYRKVQYYSHVIHLVSEVTGQLNGQTNPFALLAATFPAGTLSGAPKYKAMQLIDEIEKTARSYYGGCIGFVGFNGDFNHAIMIRTLLSKNNVLYYRGGAGIVARSIPTSEVQEVNNKLNALRVAIESAEQIH